VRPPAIVSGSIANQRLAAEGHCRPCRRQGVYTPATAVLSMVGATVEAAALVPVCGGCLATLTQASAA
jgi:hypothetical protein